MHHKTIAKAELQTGDGMCPGLSLVFIYGADISSLQMFKIPGSLLLADNQHHKMSQ